MGLWMPDIDFPAIADRANSDGEFKIASRLWKAILEIQVDDDVRRLLIDNGRIEALDAGTAAPADATVVALRGSADAWVKHLDPSPRPGWVGITQSGHIVYHGEPSVRAAYHGAVRLIVEFMREQLHGPLTERPTAKVTRSSDEIRGRYLYLDVEGTQYRVYYEESGNPDGIPLVMQHTAGSDGRQWRHVLNDPDYQRDFRLLAYDLPYHGKSSPPTGIKWWQQDYMPTKSWLFEFLTNFMAEVRAERSVFIGCSIGGLMAPVLAHELPEMFRAVIGVNAGVLRFPEGEPPAAEDVPLSHLMDVYFHPRVGNDWKASGVLELMAPSSPAATQRETAWLYASGGPQVFYGDILSYSTQFSLSQEQASEIDTSRVAVYLLTGEYDPFAIDGGANLLASWIDGVYHEVIPDAGHFAPSDNPDAFKQALDPVLKRIVSASDSAAAPEAR